MNNFYAATYNFYTTTTQAELNAMIAQLFSERISSYNHESCSLLVPFDKKKKMRRVAKDKYFSTDVSNNNVKHERTMNTKW